MRFGKTFAVLLLLIAPRLHGQAAVTTPAIPGVVAAGTPVLLVNKGLASAEGPITLADGTVYFTESSHNRIYHLDPGANDKITLLYDFKKVDDDKGERWRLSALGMDRKGLIYATRRAGPGHAGIAIVYPPDKARFLAESYQGKPFTGPNDLAIAKNGGIYFSEQGGNAQQREHSLFYLKPSGELIRIADDIRVPNGVVLSPDEKTLYAVDTLSDVITAFDLKPDGTVQTRRVFAHFKGMMQTERGPNSGGDGMAVDSKGRVYAASHAGVEVFSPKGEALGIIPVPEKAVNFTFAGKDRKTLYILGHGPVYKVQTLAQGYKGRAK
jgi:gluconolactonase